MFTHIRALLTVILLVTVQAINVHATPIPISRFVASSELSAYDKNLISDYTARGYFINNWLDNIIDSPVAGLMGPMAPSSPEDALKDLIYNRHLNRALDKLPSYDTPGVTRSYRGIYHTSESPIESRYYKGRVWIEHRYTSTSSDLKVAINFAMGAFKNEGCGGCASKHIQNPDPAKAVIITIISRTGKDITQLSAKKEEKEILYKSGLPFKVIEANRDAKGRYLVTLEELSLEDLSRDDRLALEASEAARNSAIANKYYGSPESFKASVQTWNSAYTLWARSGDLDKELDLEALAAESGD